MKLFWWLLVFLFPIVSQLSAQCTGPVNDCDGDGIPNNVDIDNDNDGIVDSVENGQGTIQWTAAQISAIATTPFTTNTGCGTSISLSATNNGGLSAFAQNATNYNTVLTTDMGVSTTLPRSMTYTSAVVGGNYGLQGSFTLTITPGTLYQLNIYFADPENTSYIITAYDASNNPIATTDWSVARYRTNGVSSTSMGPLVLNGTNATYTANGASLNFDAGRVRLGETTLLTATRIVVENYRYAGSGTGGDGLWLFVSGICRPDTDGDGIPNYQDTESDGDGCPDAIEGGASFLYPQFDLNNRIDAGVTSDGMPQLTGVPQSRGTSTNPAQFDLQSGCAFPETYPVVLNQGGAPAPTSLLTNPLQGSDEADQPLQGSWSGKAVAITAAPTNGFELLYNGSPVTTGQVIANYVPGQLSIAPGPSTLNGTTTTSFSYANIDIAGQQDATPAAYTITWAEALLPLDLVDFEISVDATCGVTSKWSSANEDNVSEFILEGSADGLDFEKMATVPAIGNGNHQYVAVIDLSVDQYYRLKMVDRDGSYRYSQVQKVSKVCNVERKIRLYPNPAGEQFFVKGLKKDDVAFIFSNAGVKLHSITATGQPVQQIDISRMPAGPYRLIVFHRDGRRSQELFYKR